MVDYMINGDTDEKAKSAPKDAELLQQFKAMEQRTMTTELILKN